jgi:hypothetical protein
VAPAVAAEDLAEEMAPAAVEVPAEEQVEARAAREAEEAGDLGEVEREVAAPAVAGERV